MLKFGNMMKPYEKPPFAFYPKKYEGNHGHLSSINVQFYGEAISIPIQKSINKVQFYLSKLGSPTGNAAAEIYATSGTLGVNALPTGSALATSINNLDVSTLTASPKIIDFNFEAFSRIGNTALVINYSGGDNNNSLKVHTGYNSNHPYNGNAVIYDDDQGYWSTTLISHVIFYAYSL